MKKQILITINLILVGAIAFFLLKGEANITGYAVKEGVIATYTVYMNITDIESGETSGKYIKGRDVFFAREKLQTYVPEKLIQIDETRIISDGSSCEKGEYTQKRHYYDSNGNSLYNADEPYIFSVKTDKNGCIIAEVPEDYKAMLALY